MKKKLLLLKDFIFKKCLFDKLDDIVNKYNNTYHSTIKITIKA